MTQRMRTSVKGTGAGANTNQVTKMTSPEDFADNGQEFNFKVESQGIARIQEDQSSSKFSGNQNLQSDKKKQNLTRRELYNQKR